MLVLSRFEGEAILIGDDIVVTVVAVRGNKIRLGITAPREVRVDRPEVREAIRRAAEARRREDDGRECGDPARCDP